MATPTLVQTTQNQEMKCSPQGLNLKFPAAVGAGNALIAVIFGARQEGPFPAKNLTDNQPDPVITNAAGSATGWNIASTNKVKNAGSLNSTGTNFTDESDPDVDATYISSYIGYKVNVSASETIKVNNTYLGPQASPTPDANGAKGVPIYDNGATVVALEFSGVNTTPVAVGQGRRTAANPALSAAGTTGSSGDLMIGVAIMDDGNSFNASSGWTVAARGKLVGGEEHYVVAYKVLAGADHASFTNPQLMNIEVLALKLHNA